MKQSEDETGDTVRDVSIIKYRGNVPPGDYWMDTYGYVLWDVPDPPVTTDKISS